MAAYYNEFDKPTAAWLRELIKAGLIADGDVDERSIKDVNASDLDGFTQCHFFAGIGGWSYALRLAGWADDVPVWTGSCPCQPYSTAGKGLGDADERNLWPEFYRLIRECRPNVVFGEQVEGAVRHGWLDGVSTDLEAEGYAVGACVLGAHSVGAPHIRQRLYWVADLHSDGCNQGRGSLAATGSDGASGNGPAGMLDVSAGKRGCWRGSVDTRGLQESRGSSSTHRLGNPNNSRPQGRDGGQLPERADEQIARPRSAWADSRAILCRDGKTRRIPQAEPDFLFMADGFLYRMADVYAEFITQAVKEVVAHAKESGTRPEETLSMVQVSVGQEAIWQATGGSRGVSPEEVLQSFLRDVSSALNGTAECCRRTQASAEACRRMLRDLRNVVQADCASLRRESQEQPDRQPADALRSLSRFLARCSETCRNYQARAYATNFPLGKKVAGRVGLLRGYGNAIVPQVAAEFIAAWMETQREQAVESPAG